MKNNWLLELVEQYPSSADPKFMEAIISHEEEAVAEARRENHVKNCYCDDDPRCLRLSKITPPTN